MRLEKKDLVKQFEEITHQEIINHNKQISATNLALKDMQKKIDDLIENHSSHIARLECRILELENNLQKATKDHDLLEKLFHVKCKSMSDEMETLDYQIQRRMDYIEDNYAEEDEFIDSINECKAMLNSFQEVLEKQKFLIHTEFYDIRTKLNGMFDDMKKEIDETPSEAPKIIAHLESKIKDAVINARGVLKEVEIAKKETFVLGKKIEHIYGILNRNKTGGVKE